MLKNYWITKPKFKGSKAARRRIKSSKNLGRWKAIDDYLLIQSVLALNDLKSVHIGTKFSCRFTLDELKHRWAILLYNKNISGLAIDSMRNLHPELIEKADQNALFSSEEEKCLSTIKELHPFVEDFYRLLAENKHIFHPTRKAKDLYNHFQLMKSYNLLPGQTIDPITSMSFSDIENLFEYNDLDFFDDHPALEEMKMDNRHKIKQIRHLENELDRWSVLVSPIAPEMDKLTLAVLRGRNVRFIMKAVKITFGRKTKHNEVDMDLSLEGPSDKISRKQGTLKFRSTGEFFLTNDGKRPIFVDGEPILENRKCKLRNQSLIEIVGLSLVFVVNYEYVNAIRQECGMIKHF